MFIYVWKCIDYVYKNNNNDILLIECYFTREIAFWRY